MYMVLLCAKREKEAKSRRVTRNPRGKWNRTRRGAPAHGRTPLTFASKVMRLNKNLDCTGVLQTRRFQQIPTLTSPAEHIPCQWMEVARSNTGRNSLLLGSPSGRQRFL